VRCTAASLPEALQRSAETVFVTTHVTSFIANAHVGRPEIDLAFDASRGVSEREFFQRRLIPTAGYGCLVPGRQLDPATAGAFHAALASSPEVERIVPAINHYALALSAWRPGMETMALAHLWMAVETLT